jgi:hypothetical protein
VAGPLRAGRGVNRRSVRVLARRAEVVDPHEVEPQRRDPHDRQPGGLPAPPAGGGAGVQVGGVHDPGDEGPDLLRVPAPVAAPRLVGPDRAGDQHRERPHREREGVQPVGQPVEVPGGGHPCEVARRAGALAGLEQVEHRRDAAEREGCGGDDRGDHVDDQPRRVECLGERRDRCVEDQDAEHEERQHDPHHDRRHPGECETAQRHQEEQRDPERPRERELVHVAPGHAVRVRGHAAADERHEVQRAPESQEDQPEPSGHLRAL